MHKQSNSIPAPIPMAYLHVRADPDRSDYKLKVEDSDKTGDFYHQLPQWGDMKPARGVKISRPQPGRRVVFFDLDNTLYSKRLGIQNQMADRIQLFMQQVLLLPEEESRRLSAKYYLDYGLSVRGILNDFKIETHEYDRFVDGGLEYDHLLKPCPKMRKWLESIHASLWIFTNAGLSHAERVLGLMGVRDLFDGIVYCDYGEDRFPAKPERLSYERAMKWAGVECANMCYFIDDAPNNVRVATELGWRAAHYDEDDDMDQSFTTSEAFPRIRIIEEFTSVFPELLVPEEQSRPETCVSLTMESLTNDRQVEAQLT